MKIHEDRSHMNIDTRWFEKGYAKEDIMESIYVKGSPYAPKQRPQPTNSFMTVTPAKNGNNISVRQVWRAAQQ